MRQPSNVDLRIFAAASLADVLPPIAAAWKGGHASFSFDATSRVARQIEAGAPADLFFSADERWMDELQEKGLLIPETRADLLSNGLVLIVSPGVQSPPKTAAAIADPTFERLALAGEAVPAGRYAREALEFTNSWDTLSDRIVEGHNVRTVLRWVSRGEAPLGIVYLTDALIDPQVVVAFHFPPQSHSPIVYPAAVVKHSAQRSEATSFLAFCQGPVARSIFEEAGFTVVAKSP